MEQQELDVREQVDREPPIHRNVTEARAGITPGRLRYVLAISTALAVIAMIAVYVIVTHGT